MDLAEEAIVIHSIKYGDNSLIVKLLSPGGLHSYMARSVQGKASRTPASVFLPLALLHIEAGIKKQGNALQMLRSASFAQPLYQSYAQPLRQAIRMFYAEVSHEVLKHEQHHEYAEIYDFLRDRILQLEYTGQPDPGLPLFFMIQMTRLLGIGMPDENPYPDTFCFDIGDARFIHHPAGQPELLITGRPAQLLATLLREERCPAIYTRNERNELLQKLILYFQVHFHAGFRIQSHEILSVVLGA